LRGKIHSNCPQRGSCSILSVKTLTYCNFDPLYLHSYGIFHGRSSAENGIMEIDQPAYRIATLIKDTFDCYCQAFQELTRRAHQYFEARDWNGGRKNALDRLDLYETMLEHIAVSIRRIVVERSTDKAIWIAAKNAFSELIYHLQDEDFAETFFNSVTRKILMTVGIDRDVEYFHLVPRSGFARCGESIFKKYCNDKETRYLIQEILECFDFRVGYENIQRDAELIAREIDLHLWPFVRSHPHYSIDVVKSPFYRNKGAYIIGRISVDSQILPLILPLVNGMHGIYVDTVLLREAEASIVFSFAHSYFLVDLEKHDELIDFLKTILPHKDVAELYASIGYQKHAKTVFYRNLHRYVHVSKEQFVIAPGKEGAVMLVFTLPQYNFVFKVIKDKPCFIRSKNETPKAITKKEVMHRYDAVAHRDRGGRLVDTQEFENMRFKRKRFSPELLQEFSIVATDCVTMDGEYVSIQHLYVQRKVVPLPMYFDSETHPEALRRVLVDFGYFLKDLAATGVFPGDLFNTWNYGVTQRGRVVLFDYDDVVPLEEINFLEKPQPRNEFEEMSLEEDWVVASPDDYFMDEIDRYSGIPYPLKGIFTSVHGDLYTLKFWHDMKARLKEGEIVDIIPYDRSKRFPQRGRSV
jgi:isocitrate dehydrogenase kinase/phosphatase